MKWALVKVSVALTLLLISGNKISKYFDTKSPLEPNFISLDLGHIIVNNDTDFVFHVTNQSNFPLTVRGTSNCCNNQGCVSTVELPNEIAQHRSIEIKMRYKPNQIGPFQQNSTLFFESVEEKSEKRIGYALIITVQGLSAFSKEGGD